MICIYAIRKTNRLSYALDLIFKTVLQLEYTLVTDFGQFLKFDGPKLLYGKKEFTSGLKIDSVELLFESDIVTQQIEVEQDMDVPYFFRTSSGALPFDLFAATFYMASRYEEYLPFESDVHDRFPARESLAFKHGFLEQPIIHDWCDWLWRELLKTYPNLKSNNRSFKTIYTYDIDEAYVFKHRLVGYQLKGLGGDLIKGKLNKLGQRLRVLLGGQADPFDTFDTLLTNHQNKTDDVIFFFKVSNDSYYDRGLSFRDSALKQLIHRIGAHHTVGLHPSYYSSRRKSIPFEKKCLDGMLGTSVIKSRQHFLRLRFPRTYQLLLDAGIREDYTMSFADAVGFRSGLCVPYQHFNIAKNEISELTVYPTTLMDGTLKDYLALTPDQAMEKINTLREVVKKHNGIFIPLWHNSSFWNETGWDGWEKVYQSLFEEA